MTSTQRPTVKLPLPKVGAEHLPPKLRKKIGKR